MIMAAAMIIFRPADFFVGGDKQNAAELARLKGEIEAMRRHRSEITAAFSSAGRRRNRTLWGNVVMRTIIALALMSTLSAGAAVAADFPPVYGAPVVVARVYDWSGIYLGAHAGIGGAQVYNTATGSSFTITSTQNQALGGGVAGLQFGGNYQINAFVIGFEIDGSWSSQNKTYTVGDFVPVTVEDRVTWLSTARLRFGAAINRALLYATVGGAYGEFKRTVNIPPIFVPFFGVIPGSTTLVTDQRPGIAVGLGVEYAFTQALIGRVEFLALRSAERTNTISGVTFSDYLVDGILRVGLSYKFGGGP
jgi:outer membrane immunogenic protein